jgi:hypothetical protein
MRSNLGGIRRLSPPGAKRTDYDIIASPLPLFDIENPESAPVGTSLQAGIKARHVVTPGCTDAGCNYLGHTGRALLIIHAGDGWVGEGAVEGDRVALDALRNGSGLNRWSASGVWGAKSRRTGGRWLM